MNVSHWIWFKFTSKYVLNLISSLAVTEHIQWHEQKDVCATVGWWYTFDRGECVSPHPCATAWRCRDVGCILLESITSSNLALGVDGSWFRLALSNVRPPFPLSTFWPFFSLLLSLRLALPPHYLFFQPTIFFPLSSSVVLTVYNFKFRTNPTRSTEIYFIYLSSDGYGNRKRFDGNSWKIGQTRLWIRCYG